VGTEPLKVIKLFSFRQKLRTHRPELKKSGKPPIATGFGVARKGPCLRAVSMHLTRTQGYRELGVPTKKRGCPTEIKTNRKYFITDLRAGCK